MIAEAFMFAGYLLACLGVVLTMIGWAVDISE